MFFLLFLHDGLHSDSMSLRERKFSIGAVFWGYDEGDAEVASSSAQRIAADHL